MAGNVGKVNWQRQPLLISSIITNLLSIQFSGSKMLRDHGHLSPPLPPASLHCSCSLLQHSAPALLERAQPWLSVLLQRPRVGGILLHHFRGQGHAPLLLSHPGAFFNGDRPVEDSWSLGQLPPLLSSLHRDEEELFGRIFCVDLKKSNW